MAADEALPVDVSALDFTKPVADLDAIRKVNPHRFEFEMLTGIVFIDPKKHVIVGYKDLFPTDFWARGHMPGFPLFPGVLMCEAAAQLCCYYTVTQKVVDEGALMGLGGIDEARFVRPARPGDRLVLVGQGLKVHRRLNRFRVTGLVNGEKAFEATVTGVPIGRLEDLRGA